jgi:hypothetical protein
MHITHSNKKLKRETLPLSSFPGFEKFSGVVSRDKINIVVFKKLTKSRADPHAQSGTYRTKKPINIADMNYIVEN